MQALIVPFLHMTIARFFFLPNTLYFYLDARTQISLSFFSWPVFFYSYLYCMTRATCLSRLDWEAEWLIYISRVVNITRATVTAPPKAVNPHPPPARALRALDRLLFPSNIVDNLHPPPRKTNPAHGLGSAHSHSCIKMFGEALWDVRCCTCLSMIFVMQIRHCCTL